LLLKSKASADISAPNLGLKLMPYPFKSLSSGQAGPPKAEIGSVIC
jgi:hypothetical protein